MNDDEKADQATTIIKVDEKKLTVTCKTKTFTAYDKNLIYVIYQIYGPSSSQEMVYRDMVAPQVERVIAGYNCTVFAYGQTGTGKTYTMEGGRYDSLSYKDDEKTGIIPRAVEHIFEELEQSRTEEYSVRVSYLELYNEELYDLLAPTSDDRERLRIFDDPSKKGMVVISGAEEIPVKSRSQVYALLKRGADKRTTAATLLNMNSSRSHSIFMLSVVIRENTANGEELVKQEYNEEIEKLRRDLRNAREKNGIFLSQESYNGMEQEIAAKTDQLREIEGQLDVAYAKLQRFVEDMAMMDDQYQTLFRHSIRLEDKLHQRVSELEDTKKARDTIFDQQLDLEEWWKKEENILNIATQNRNLACSVRSKSEQSGVLTSLNKELHVLLTKISAQLNNMSDTQDKLRNEISAWLTNRREFLHTNEMKRRLENAELRKQAKHTEKVLDLAHAIIAEVKQLENEHVKQVDNYSIYESFYFILQPLLRMEKSDESALNVELDYLEALQTLYKSRNDTVVDASSEIRCAVENAERTIETNLTPAFDTAKKNINILKCLRENYTVHQIHWTYFWAIRDEALVKCLREDLSGINKKIIDMVDNSWYHYENSGETPVKALSSVPSDSELPVVPKREKLLSDRGLENEARRSLFQTRESLLEVQNICMSPDTLAAKKRSNKLEDIGEV
uniref:Kinesin motor domain-containing protein n=1 Tax=Heterorhabditis bacteriophora TaxID=37862 RepID=A0A1I7XTM8_HETBA